MAYVSLVRQENDLDADKGRLHYLYFRRKHQIHDPPRFPIPGDENGPDVPKYMGSTFIWVCKFWRIVQKPAQAGKAIYDGLDLTEAQAVFHELLKFSDELPDDARRTESCPNHVLVLQ